RLHSEGIENTVCEVQRLHLFRFPHAGDGAAIERPYAEVLKRAVLFAIGEIHGGRAVDITSDSGDARRQMPHAGQAVRSRIGQRLEENSVNDAEDGGVSADAERQCQQRDEGEHRRAAEPAEHLPQGSHGTLYDADPDSVRSQAWIFLSRGNQGLLSHWREGIAVRGPRLKAVNITFEMAARMLPEAPRAHIESNLPLVLDA